METSQNRYYRTCVLNATASFKDGKTILSDKFYTQPFKLMKPFHIKKDLMTLMMQTASAGILKGDTQEQNFIIEDNAKMELTAQSFEKLHKMDGGSARRDTTIKVGKNALFYDRQGRDWEAEVVKIIDNPISIGQAFWSPYRKLGEWVTGLINKSAAEKEKKSFDDMTAKLQSSTDKSADKPATPAPFDIARFAGIFAAIGMAVGAIGAFLTSLLEQVVGMKAWALMIIPALLIIISGPSMILAWMKLRKRNLAPLLNANGWAINADAIVSVMFGNTLTEQAQFPMLKIKKPGLSKGGKWAIAVATILVSIAIAMVTLYLCGLRVCACFI